MHVIISDIEKSLGVIFVCNYYIKKFQTFLPSACVPYYDHKVVCVSFHFYIPPYIINFSDYNEIEQFCVPPVVCNCYLYAGLLEKQFRNSIDKLFGINGLF
jgi:hypothetical protein